MKQSPLLECRNLSLVLDNKKILDDVTFSLQKGEDLVVLGPNGAGKTMLLSVLSGNLPPTTGQIFIFGKPLYAKDSYQIKKQIGFVSPKLFEDYDNSSVIEDIVLSGLFGSIGLANDPTKNNTVVVRAYIKRVISEKHQAERAQVKILLKRLEIEHLRYAVFGHLSYGEKVRVLIARSLINNPALFILDEPTTGLDLKMRAEFAHVLDRLASDSEIVYVTHHIEEIPLGFKKVLMLKQAKVFGFGNKDELLTSEHISSLLDTHITIHQEQGKFVALF